MGLLGDIGRNIGVHGDDEIGDLEERTRPAGDEHRRDSTLTEQWAHALDEGVIGSRFDGMSARIRSSRIMKFVAEVSSSMSRVRALASTASTRLAAWDVDPLAFVVEKNLVSVPDGRLLMNGEMSSPVTARPSSARMAVALGSVMTHSRPSSAMCG